VPDAWFDGVDNSYGGYSSGSMFPVYNPIVAGNIAEGSPLSMTARFVMATATAGTLFVHVDVDAAVTTTNNYAHFVVVEEGITTYGITPGLARDVLADEAFTLTTPGQSVDYVKTFTLDGSWSLPNVSFVCFVETHNPPKTVIQAVRAERADGLRVSPADELYAIGDPGGPFAPASQVYTLENLGGNPLDFSVAATQPWITITGGSGTIAAHGSADVTVEFNMLACMLESGIHEDTLTFTNTTNNVGTTTVPVTLQMGQYELVYDFPLDTSPGWATFGAMWQWGQPTGGGGENGFPDPTSGHTGPNCYGYNLNGDYENSLSQKHLTTPALDLSGYVGVRVDFWRWLGVEDDSFDSAYFRAGRTLASMTLIWRNLEEITDAEWTPVSYDISAVADQQPAVYLRWTMGATSSTNRYCGWNIDDVQVWGIPFVAADVPDGNDVSDLHLLPGSPNPFRDAASIAYNLPSAGSVTIGVYDVSGRLVRQVLDGASEAGLHAVQWDGTDASGKAVAAGVYFCRIDAGGETDTQSIVFLK
jgi:hypothetical protein